MSNLKTLQDAIADLNKKFGGAEPDTNPIRNQVFKQPKYVNKNKKWAKVRQAIFNHKEISFQAIPSNMIKKALMDHLEVLRYEYVIPNFYYQGSEMDVFAMTSDKVIEFEIKAALDDYSHDFDKTYNYVKFKQNKHSVLENGKALPNFFYFVAPAGMLQPEDVPGHCGLIVAKVAKVPDWKTIRYLRSQGKLAKTKYWIETVQFEMLKAAPVLKKDYVPASFFKYIAKKCYDRYRLQLDTSNLPDNDTNQENTTR